MIYQYAARLEITGSQYHIFPIVHVSKLKLVRHFPDRLEPQLVTEGSDRLAFDEALLPEDSGDAPLGEGEFEVERTSGPAGDHVTDVCIATFWCIRRAIKSRRGWMKQT
ncbi:unnamed protein product [Phytophthora fragariaefolia]|uniref:Unnamed protein product n=1 Tax=Phytophthora fragariaefolia TaxID=1490495 RepID=A0A9W7CSV4_9STRA|nr:unnamed protein product [Phytophthora fragariaefolia]